MFKAISCLKINLVKSKFVPIKVSANVGELTTILGCRLGILTTSYLGLLLGAPSKVIYNKHC